jgi:histidine phosphotransferase ChpT
MSEAFETPPPDDEDLDALALSALLSSRVCHDLINPVGAIGSGLEVLDDPEIEGSMREAAFDLIRSGAVKAIALLSYARLAYGAAGGYGAEISLDDAIKALTDLFAVTKAELDWQIGGGLAAKEKVKVLLIIAYAAAECAPRGGKVSITGDINNFVITATGQKVLLNESLVRALGGDTHEIAPKFTPALIASRLVGVSGGKISADLIDGVTTFRVAFGAETGDS